VAHSTGHLSARCSSTSACGTTRSSLDRQHRSFSQQVDQAIALTADLVSAGEVADEEMRQARAAAGMSATAIRNLHSRVVSTLQPDSTLKVRSRITCLAYMHRNACFLRAQSIRADRGDFRKYILECVKVIGERIADLVAITGGYAAWKARTYESIGLPKQQCCPSLPPCCRS